jgi:hypothetical protein
MTTNSIDSLAEEMKVAIKTHHQTYISALPNASVEYRDSPDGQASFTLIRKGKRQWAFRTSHGQYLSAFSKDNVLFTADTPLRREAFLLGGPSLSEVTLYSKFHAFYLSAQRNAKLECNRSEAREWEHFAIEIVSR